jgi:prevent-host-death family protein
LRELAGTQGEEPECTQRVSGPPLLGSHVVTHLAPSIRFYDNQTMGEMVKISATEAARNFSDLINRVYYRGQTFVVERGGAPVCKISPAEPVRFTRADFVQLLSSLPLPDRAFLDILEEVNRTQEPLAKSRWDR